MYCSPEATPPGWHASLSLGFDRAPEPTNRRTRLYRREHHGPLQVQRPFYPEDNGCCHVYLLHPPGGVVGGDQLDLDARAEHNAAALLTTPAAAKFYRSTGNLARQTQQLYAGAGATLEWLPQETIIYRDARLHSVTHVELHEQAAFIGWEILCLGRPAAGERFDRGLCQQHIEIYRGGEPLLIEHARFDGNDGDAISTSVANAAWGLRRQPVSATLIAVAAKCPNERQPTVGIDIELLRDALHTKIDTSTGDLIGISDLGEVLVCRYLGASAQRARNLFIHAWTLLRPAYLAKTACPPRVWNC